jgi:predicted XRE-type DNA-binding protein
MRRGSAGLAARIEIGMDHTDNDVEPVRGSGNVLRGFVDANSDVEQARVILAAKIIKILDERGLSVRKAQSLTGVAAAEFSRLRNARLARFTIDRMITILGKFDQDVEVSINVRPRSTAA